MNQLDNYLESLHEGKVWDKVKKVWRDHKGKIITGAKVAGLVAAAYAGSKYYDTTPAGKERLAKKAKEDAAEKVRDQATIARLRKQDADKKDRNSKIGAAFSGTAHALKVMTTPERWLLRKGKDAAVGGVKAVGNTIKDKVIDTVRDTKDRIKFRNELK